MIRKLYDVSVDALIYWALVLSSVLLICSAGACAIAILKVAS